MAMYSEAENAHWQNELTRPGHDRLARFFSNHGGRWGKEWYCPWLVGRLSLSTCLELLQMASR